MTFLLKRGCVTGFVLEEGIARLVPIFGNKIMKVVSVLISSSPGMGADCVIHMISFA